MELTNIELAAVLKLGMDMLMADGKVHENEQSTISVEMIRFGVSPEKFVHLSQLAQAMDSVEAIATVRTFDDEEKKHVTAFLAIIMISDGDIDDSEMKLWCLISKLASLPQMTVQEAIELWTNWAQQ